MAADPRVEEGFILPHDQEGLVFPDYPMSGVEQERFQREWERYIGRSQLGLDNEEVNRVYLACRAGWWMRHLDHLRRAHEGGNVLELRRG